MDSAQRRKVLRAAKKWARAHYHFRWGPYAFSQESHHWMDKAEQRLLKAVMGTRNLEEVGRILKEEQKEQR